MSIHVSRRAFLGSMASMAAMAADRPPNLVLILTDDQGWWDLGANGNRQIRTPNVDRLASEGVRFTHFYCSPVCSPTRAALMTGRHYQRTGAIDTFCGRDTLDRSERTLAEILKARGYRTACVGKWHLGRYMRYHPNERGFDEYFGFWQYGFMNYYEDSMELWDNKQRVEATGYVTDVLTDRALRFMSSGSSQPYFLYLTYNAPHAPYLVPDKYIEPYLKAGLPLQQARIYGMVTCIDDNVGQLLKQVDDNTVVIFMSDNGGVSSFQKLGLRANKGTAYEGGIRVPFIARWPGRFPSGAVVDAPAQHVDVLPTVCDLTGATPPKDRKLDGYSILPLLKKGGGVSPHPYIYSQWNRVRPVLDTIPGNRELRASWSIRDRDGWKLHSSGELFDLRQDPGEQTNLADKEPARARELRAEFERWFRDVTDRRYERVPIEVGRPDENPVEIDVTWGDPTGKVFPQYRAYNRDTIDRWSDPGDFVRWKVDVVAPGSYELILSYGCEPSSAGSRTQFSIGAASVEHTFTATPGRMVFATRTAGVMKLGAGAATFEVKPLEIKGSELAAIHKIWLRRV